jgi:dihydrofolate reductase
LIGGAQLYGELLQKCSELFLTLVKREVAGDTFLSPSASAFRLEEVIFESSLWKWRFEDTGIFYNGPRRIAEFSARSAGQAVCRRSHVAGSARLQNLTGPSLQSPTNC